MSDTNSEKREGDAFYHIPPGKECSFTKEKKKRKRSNLELTDHMWKIKHGKWPAHGRVTTLERDHMGLQQMAMPRAGDNRVAAQMDGRHVHNKQTPVHISPL